MKKLFSVLFAASLLAVGFIPAASGDGPDPAPCTSQGFPPADVEACVAWIQQVEMRLRCAQNDWQTGPCRALEALFYRLDIAIYRESDSDPGFGSDAGEVPTGVWDTDCERNIHSAQDDPLVSPDLAGGSHHMHDFFGNRRTNAFSTGNSLLAQHREDAAPGGFEVGCQDVGDGAAYWFPALYDLETGKKRVPKGVHAYYRAYGTARITDFPLNTQSLPRGFGMVSDHYQYACAVDRGETKGPDIPACPNSRFVGIVDFPDCWNGARFDPNNPGAHMAYRDGNPPTDSVCPPTHPIRVPELSLVVNWASKAGSDTTWYLSSDPLGQRNAHSLHADFLNAWEPDKQHTLNEVCLQLENRDKPSTRQWCKGNTHPMPPPQ